MFYCRYICYRLVICSLTYSAFPWSLSAFPARKSGKSNHLRIKNYTTSFTAIIAQSVRPTVILRKPSR